MPPPTFLTNLTPELAFPLLFETGVNEYPYGLAGTGILVNWKGTNWVVTADHCLKDGQHDLLRIPLSDRTGKLLKLKHFFYDVTPSTSSDEKCDVAIFSTEMSGDEQLEAQHKFIPIPVSFTFETMLQKLNDPNTKIPLVVIGYPRHGTETEIKYTENRIVTQAAKLSASYVRASPLLFSHEILFESASPISDLNDMSGSPVFGVTKYHGELVYFLVGMMSHGAFPIGHFLSFELIRSALTSAAKKVEHYTSHRATDLHDK